MNGKVYALCPQCRGPLTLTEAVDTQQCLSESGIAELSIPYSKDPVPIQILKCLRCGYQKLRILQGLPDDEQPYIEWALGEANMLSRGDRM